MSLYPKMLYKGEAIYTDSQQIKEDLSNKNLKTIIVSDEESESLRREQGYVDLSAVMKPKNTATLHLPPVVNSTKRGRPPKKLITTLPETANVSINAA